MFPNGEMDMNLFIHLFFALYCMPCKNNDRINEEPCFKRRKLSHRGIKQLIQRHGASEVTTEFETFQKLFVKFCSFNKYFIVCQVCIRQWGYNGERENERSCSNRPEIPLMRNRQ